jgi:hypothetical protein
VRKLHVIGAVIILLWLAALGWLVWRQRHSPAAQPPERGPRVVGVAWHAGCGVRAA